MNATCESSITGRRRPSLSPEGAASQHFLHCDSRTGRCNPVRIPANNSHCFAPFRADSHPFAPENFLCAFNQPWLPWSKRPLSVHYTKPNISERKGWGGQNPHLANQQLTSTLSERSLGFVPAFTPPLRARPAISAGQLWTPPISFGVPPTPGGAFCRIVKM